MSRIFAILFASAAALLLNSNGFAQQSSPAIAQLVVALSESDELTPDLSGLPVWENPATKIDIALARDLLTEHRKKVLRRERTMEVQSREIQIGKHRLRFALRTFGEEPVDGHSLYFSMHGGGGTAAAVNDRQWENQKRLYQLKEGIYVTPRAPTNTWNLWHQAHIDPLFDRLIEDLVAIEGVNWNRVYLMGYSAGGDGVYQLAPRMADRWAAAAMMAGHPNETSPLGLRNVPFALQVGANDAAYKRNQIAEEWKQKLADLSAGDPGGYKHFVKVYPGLGHWMNRKDAIALDWMATHTRNPVPMKLVWKQDDVTHLQHYWLAVDDAGATKGRLLKAEIDQQTISISCGANEQGKKVIVRLDDRMMDLDLPVKIVSGDVTLFEGEVSRTISTLAKTLAERHDPFLAFPAEITVTLP